MSQEFPGRLSITGTNYINPEKPVLFIENNEINGDTESLVRLGELHRLHSTTGERTISAGGVIPIRKHNLAELKSTCN